MRCSVKNAEGFEFSGAGLEGAGAGASDFFEALFGEMRRREASPRHRGRHRESGQDHHAKIPIDLSDTFEGATHAISLKVPEIDARGHVALKDAS